MAAASQVCALRDKCINGLKQDKFNGTFCMFFLGGVDHELTDILLNMSAEEQKWFIRMLLKDLKLQVSQSDILNTIHPDAKELYDVCNNLQKVKHQKNLELC